LPSLITITIIAFSTSRITSIDLSFCSAEFGGGEVRPPVIASLIIDSDYEPPEEEFVEIVLNVLDREEGVDRDIALLIADGVYNRLKSSNIRECVRIDRLAKNDSAQVNRIVDTFAKYGSF
jgi:hypothetical protein